MKIRSEPEAVSGLPKITMNRPSDRFFDVATQAVSILCGVQKNQRLDRNRLATPGPRFTGEKIEFEKTLPVLLENGIDGPASPDDLDQRFHRGLALCLDDHMRKLLSRPIQQCRKHPQRLRTASAIGVLKVDILKTRER